MIRYSICGVLLTLLCAPTAQATSLPLTSALQDADVKDKRPEVKELIEQLKAGVLDASAVLPRFKYDN